MRNDHLPFEIYANYYDLIYKNKNYENECDFVEAVFHKYSEKRISRVLDVGCGTGGHSIPLAKRGYSVVGIDRSLPMIEHAREKIGSLSNIVFQLTDITDKKFFPEKNFDAVISMFAVIDYQTTNRDVKIAIENVHKVLVTGGLFICEFWYGPAVLNLRPETRISQIVSNEHRLIKIAQPTVSTNFNLVTVDYNLLVIHDNKLVQEIKEKHTLRYFFFPEMQLFFSQSGLNIKHICAAYDLSSSISESTWNVVIIASAD
jgi:SAM-dependent methyltransferase